MKTLAFSRYSAMLVMSCFLTACSNNPKAVQPTLGAASTALAPAPVQAPAEIVETPRGPSLTLNNVLFDFEQSSLRPEADATVAKAAAYLKENPERTALVEGHTDHIGDKQYNQGLSVERSKSVKNALIIQGVSPERIRTKGFGETRPVADNSDRQGRQSNRRVEVIFKVAN